MTITRTITETVNQRVNRYNLEGQEAAAIALSDRPTDQAAIDHATDAGARWARRHDCYALSLPGKLETLAIVHDDGDIEFGSGIDRYRNRTAVTTEIQKSVAMITKNARMAIELTGMSATRALTWSATSFVKEGNDAKTRRGLYAYETTTEQIETVLFNASVARDILDAAVSRPSVGNVRTYALSQLDQN